MTTPPSTPLQTETINLQYVNVCFTLNNPTEPIQWNEEKMHYLVYQEEIAPNTGTHHFQGYVELKKPTRLGPLKALLTGDKKSPIHVEKRRGAQEQAIDYCKKEESRKPGTNLVEHGTPKANRPGQGKRNDIVEFRNAIVEESKNKRDLIFDDQHINTIARHKHLYDTINNSTRPKKPHPAKIILLIGDAGLGKTRYVMDKHRDDPSFYALPVSNGTLWFDDYDRHKTVLIDDFAGRTSAVKLDTILKILDPWNPQKLPYKGGHCWWNPETVYITTNIPPSEWYEWNTKTDMHGQPMGRGRVNQYPALARRFYKVLTFKPEFQGTNSLYQEEPHTWWQDNAPPGAEGLYYHDDTALYEAHDAATQEDVCGPPDLSCDPADPLLEGDQGGPSHPPTPPMAPTPNPKAKEPRKKRKQRAPDPILSDEEEEWGYPHSPITSPPTKRRRAFSELFPSQPSPPPPLSPTSDWLRKRQSEGTGSTFPLPGTRPYKK